MGYGIKETTYTTRQPSGRPDDFGQCEVGFYKLENDVVQIVDAGGAPVRGNSGEPIIQKLPRGGASDDGRQIARRLLLTHWQHQRAASGTVSGFGKQRIRYSKPYGGY
jgi:hypothetical protein